MKILIVSAEVAPFAKVGGLADVAGALPKALRELGHDARVVMPLYGMIERDPRWQVATTLDEFEVEMNPHWTKRATFKETELEGMPVGFIGTDEWYPPAISSESLYQPGGMQHLFFCKAVLRAMEELDWIPDIVHGNDWHCGFLPVLMREKGSPAWDASAAVFTIHNLAYQGEFGLEALDALDLPHSLYVPEKLETWGRVNFLKAGCAYSDRVNTVSEKYAEEIQTPEYGCTLDGLMRHLQDEGRLSGILNGIDTQVFDPANDPALPAAFTAENLAGKAVCRTEMLHEIGLPPITGAPVMGVVSRLSSQKGLDLILEVADQMLSLPTQLVVLGVGDPALVEGFRKLQARRPDHFRFVERFDAALAQRIYAGCDLFLMPSRFEPCGLGQLIALRYGTIPVVRSTGGLADTVFEGRNGFAFSDASAEDLLAAVARAQAFFNLPAEWSSLMVSAMKGDYGWAASARRYADLYRAAQEDRALSSAA